MRHCDFSHSQVGARIRGNQLIFVIPCKFSIHFTFFVLEKQLIGSISTILVKYMNEFPVMEISINGINQ